MVRPDIQAIGAKWIAELRLQDRIITIRYTTNLCDPFGNLVYGLMTIQNLDEGRFLIEVQDPSTWPAGGSRALSDESITEGIVHELVHIRWIDLTAHNPDPAAIVQEERATWATARALVQANQSTRAAIVRAMIAKPAAMRRQTTGNKSMDVLDLVLAALAAALTAEDPKAAIQALLSEVKALKEKGTAAPDSVPTPMPQGTGDEYGKDKPPVAMGDEKEPDRMMRTMKADLAEIRAMKLEAKEALDMVRPAAKAEIVRTMRADGIALTPHAEKLILDAPTVDAAKDRAETIRAMAPAGAKRQQSLPPMGDEAGLTPAQSAKYRGMVVANNPRAETYRDECVRQNKKGGAK